MHVCVHAYMCVHINAVCVCSIVNIEGCLLHSGSIGAENLEEVDNAQEPFNPFTVKRVPIPRPSETAQ